MARIRSYDAGEGLGLKPSELATSALNQEARVVGNAYSAAGAMEGRRGWGDVVQLAGTAYYNYEDNKQKNQGAVTGSELNHNLTQSWNQWVKDAVKDGTNDSSMGKRFQEEVVKPALEKWRDGFWTEGASKWADNFVNSTREHFFQKTTADMATLDGEAAAVGTRRGVNFLSNMVKDDPTSLNLALGSLRDMVDSAIDGSPNLTGTQAVKLKKELRQNGMESIALAAVMGAIQRDPENGAKLATDPRFAPFIDAQKVKQLESYARSELRAERAEKRYNEAALERAQAKASDDTEVKILQKLESGEKFTKREMLDIPNDQLSRAAKERLLSRMETLSRKEEALPAISRPVYLDLSQRIRLPEGDPNRVNTLDEVWDAQKDLTNADFDRLVKQYREQRTPDGAQLQERERFFFEAMKSQFMNGLDNLDKDGKERFYNFQQEYFRRKADMMKNGKSPFHLMDNKSPDYMGDPATIKGFQLPLQEQIKNMVQSVAPPGLPSLDEQRVKEQYPDAKRMPGGYYTVERVNPTTGKKETFRVTPRNN